MARQQASHPLLQSDFQHPSHLGMGGDLGQPPIPHKLPGPPRLHPSPGSHLLLSNFTPGVEI